jgi:hypothetical protein
VRIAPEAPGAALARKASIAASSPKGAPMAARALAKHLARGEDGPLIAKMIEAGRVRLHDDATTLPSGVASRDGVIRGVTMPDGTIHLVAGNLTPKDARAVLLHEAFHAGAEPLIGSKSWNTLMSHVRTATDAAIRRKAAGQSRASDSFWRASLDQARRSGAPDAHLAEEIAAYVIEHREAAPAGLREMADNLIGAVKAFILRKFGRQFGDVTPGQLRALASPAFIRNAVKAERYAHEGVRDKDGNPIVESVAPQDVLKQLIGFTPAEVAERYARNTFQRNEQERIKAERSRAMQAAARSRMAEDDAAQERAEEKVDRFNDRFPEKRITPKSIRQEIRRLHNKSGRMEFGVDLDDKLEARIKDRTAPSIYSRE